MGTELSRTVATFIVQKILTDELGLSYICATPERFFAVGAVLTNMVDGQNGTPSPRLLKHILRYGLCCCCSSCWHAKQASVFFFNFAMLDQLFGFECSHTSRANLRADISDETNSLEAKQNTRETNFVSMIQPHPCDIPQCQNLCSSPGYSPPHLTCPVSECAFHHVECT
jgi:hypothetical protein